MSAQAKLLRSIEERLDEIVRLAEKCVINTKAAKKKKKDKLEESQLRNLQNLASATDSVAALENFIAYQMGRRKIPLEVGGQIMDDLQWIGRQAEEIAAREKADKQAERRLRMEMIRMYLGFLVRKFVAERKEERS